MSIAAWPFLVGRNRTLGYQVVVSPQFLSVSALSYLLTQIAGGDESPPAGATAREIHIRGAGKISVIFRVVKPQAQEYDVGDTDVLRDAGGRPIRLIEGFVVQGGIKQLKKIILTQEDLQMVHDQVKEAYRAFWSADEIVSEWASMPFDLKTPTSADDQITLQVETPLEVPRPPGRRRVTDPSMSNRPSRRLQVIIAASFILLVLIAVAIIYLLLAHTPQFFRQLRWEVLFYCGGIQRLSFGNPLSERFCEKCKGKLRNVGMNTTTKKLQRRPSCHRVEGTRDPDSYSILPYEEYFGSTFAS